eukprot:gnl/TRDRNA2_/TRDRNA2_187961_c0_seq1.p1 gnl/TRDRNA2_/TRDRNA2_187961_c0~~gnl/TRDRNA2_/TRDRNA2_187961_c0_seq1.p1  ORF type:complete len:457 (+),score=65.49 gnl/TRDRNA2_/TRDRNA2_187961_c0_seq1:50-1372(+)
MASKALMADVSASPAAARTSPAPSSSASGLPSPLTAASPSYASGSPPTETGATGATGQETEGVGPAMLPSPVCRKGTCRLRQGEWPESGGGGSACGSVCGSAGSERSPTWGASPVTPWWQSGQAAAAARGSRGTPVANTSTPARGEAASATAARMWRVDDFELGPCVGAGSFGHVQLARERSSAAVVVLKVMRKRRLERLRVQRHVAREIEIQAHLRHENILRLYGFFWDAAHIYMILERAPEGDLGRLLRRTPRHRLEEEEAAPLVARLASALSYMHRLHVIHRDLKPQNVLLARGRQPKLADFGWAVHTYPHERRWTLCGTLDYLPPEMVHASCGHSFGVDVWGLGVLAYELLTGEPPFVAPSREETCRRILEATVPAFPEQISNEAGDLVTRLVRRDESARLPLEEVAGHAWISARAHTHLQVPGSARPLAAALAGA